MTFKKAIDSVKNSLELLQIGPAVINTVVLSLGQLVFSILVCGFGGYSLSKLKPTGTKFIFALVVWTMMIPSQIALVPNYISWLHFPFAFDFGVGINLLDTYWPMWLMAGADTFSVLLFKNAFDGLSNSYMEAAKVDGCNNFQIFFKIMLPLVAPVIIYQSVMVLSAAWSNFMIPLLVLDQKEIIPPKYETLWPLDYRTENGRTLFLAKENGKYGLITKNEDIILPFEYKGKPVKYSIWKFMSKAYFKEE
jgi:ABC-type glycerol-3-phosphate transport system permease component